VRCQLRIVKWLRAYSRSGRWQVRKRTIVKWLRAFSRSGRWNVRKRSIVKWLRAFSCSGRWNVRKRSIVKWLRAFSCSIGWKVGKRTIVKWLRAFLCYKAGCWIVRSKLTWAKVGFLSGLEIRDWFIRLRFPCDYETSRQRQKMLVTHLRAGLQTILSRSDLISVRRGVYFLFLEFTQTVAALYGFTARL